MKPVFIAVFSVPAQFYSAFTALMPYITRTFVRGLRISGQFLNLPVLIYNMKNNGSIGTTKIIITQVKDMPANTARPLP
jgi:hypothetical protein